MNRELTKEDLMMFVTMNGMKKLSKCIDKQVVCLIVDEGYNILSVGINTIEACDQNCADKDNRLCVVRHAEQVAVDNLAALNIQRARRAYVSLFPCVSCQLSLDPFVDEIVAFGMVHKQWVSDKLVVFPHISYKLLEASKNSKDVDIIAQLHKTAKDKGFSRQAILEVLSDIDEIHEHDKNPNLYLQATEDRVALYSLFLDRIGTSCACKVKQ